MDFENIVKGIRDAMNGKVQFVKLGKYIVKLDHYSSKIETIDYIQDKLTEKQKEI